VLSALGRRRYGGFSLNPNPDDLRFLSGLLESGDLTPVVDQQYPLKQVPDAIRNLEAGRATGKLVITVESRSHPIGLLNRWSVLGDSTELL
jgi:NADPH:quinone reductase-like Zn-dependent oxidoreductase